ncbi:MAG: hypothetical protein II885_00700 [Oscillospiraceae bacterium]|nr:hypothetical protein [Oscillospiraceae bacterium]
MKTVYIPAGETVKYKSLVTENLIVDGCLKVVYGVKAGSISGRGVISAGTVYADDISIGEIEAAAVVCVRAAAKRIDAPEVYASEALAVSCFLSAAYVETGKLTVALSDVDEAKADEIIHLPRAGKSLPGMLIASLFRSLRARLFTKPAVGEVLDADFEPFYKKSAADEDPEDPMEPALDDEEDSDAEEETVDEELNRIVSLFKLSREAGYTLRLIPGTPEENAPVFDFAAETIVQKAA